MDNRLEPECVEGRRVPLNKCGLIDGFDPTIFCTWSFEVKLLHITLSVATQRCSQWVPTYLDHSLSVEAQLLLLQVLTERGLDDCSNIGNSTGGRARTR